MNAFLIVYKHNSSIAYKNMVLEFDSAPVLSQIQLKIIQDQKWSINDFSIINIIPIRNEINLCNID